MSNDGALIPVFSAKPAECEDMFVDLPDMDLFELKKDQLATQLAALMSFAKKNRTSMADRLGWKKSRVTRVLSGSGNPTIKTIWEFCDALDYDFDVVFRSIGELPPKQPWQKVHQVGAVPTDDVRYDDVEYLSEIRVTAHAPMQVAMDVFNGTYQPIYFSLDALQNSLGQIPIANNWLPDMTLSTVSVSSDIAAAQMKFTNIEV